MQNTNARRPMIYKQNTETGVWYGVSKSDFVSASWNGRVVIDEGNGAVPGPFDQVVNVPANSAPADVRRALDPVEDLTGVAEAYNAS